MTDLFGRSRSEDETAQAHNILIIVIGVLGYLIGSSIGKDRAWNDAGVWAVQTTRQCEASYRAKGFASVTDCLKGAIASAEEAERQD